MDERDLSRKLLEEIFKALGWGTGHPWRAPFSLLFFTTSRRLRPKAIASRRQSSHTKKTWADAMLHPKGLLNLPPGAAG